MPYAGDEWTMPGALLQRHELGEIDRRRAVVERMAEREVLERRALRRRDDAAFALVALEAGVDQILGENEVDVALLTSA